MIGSIARLHQKVPTLQDHFTYLLIAVSLRVCLLGACGCRGCATPTLFDANSLVGPAS